MRRLFSLVAALSIVTGVWAADPAKPLRILNLGDSYTEGTSIKPNDAWPARLARRLRVKNRAVAEPTVVARVGWTVDELLAAMNAAQLEGPYDLVTLMIGVNDQFRGGDAQTYRGKLVTAVGRAIELSGRRPSRVLLISIPDYSVTPFGRVRDPEGTRRGIDAFNAVAAEVARLYGLRWVDVTPASRLAANDAALIAEDGLHPSPRMHEAWAGAIHRAAERAVMDAAPPAR